MKYLCYQNVVMSTQAINNNYDVYMEVVIRIVQANSKEEALGKFVINTSDIIASKKLDPYVYELDNIKQIN